VEPSVGQPPKGKLEQGQKKVGGQLSGRRGKEKEREKKKRKRERNHKENLKSERKGRTSIGKGRGRRVLKKKKRWQ